MHYAVRMALEDGIAALDAGKAAAIPSGVLTSLKVRRGALEAFLAYGKAPGPDEHFAARERAELAVVARLLDALAAQAGETSP